MKLSPSEISEIGLFLRVRMRTMVRLGSNETELLSILWGTVFTIDCEIYASIAFRILEYFNKLIIPFFTVKNNGFLFINKETIGIFSDRFLNDPTYHDSFEDERLLFIVFSQKCLLAVRS